jgi:polyisoprenoid-binding protein YceI
MVTLLRNRVLASVATLALAASSALAATTYKVDPVHSQLLFKVNHLGVSNNWGSITAPQGSIVVGDDGAPTAVSVEVKAANVDTHNDKRDNHLKGPDFFDVKQFPTLSFKSTSIKKTGDNTFEVVGNFTLKGVTKPITVTLTKVGEAQTGMGRRSGYDTSFTIKRSEYGMAGLVGPVGDEVTIFVSLEGVAG